MDDPRFQQFFLNPDLPQQRRYEAIRAVVIEEQPLQTVAQRFGFAYGTLRNLVGQFRASIRQEQTPPFLLLLHADDLRVPLQTKWELAPIGPPSPTADCSHWTENALSARALPGCSCSSRYWLNWASINSSNRPVIRAPE
jgi:hypothetical protein